MQRCRSKYRRIFIFDKCCTIVVINVYWGLEMANTFHVGILNADGFQGVGENLKLAWADYEPDNPGVLYLTEITGRKHLNLILSGAYSNRGFWTRLTPEAATEAYRDGRYDDRFIWDDETQSIGLNDTR